MPDPTPTPEDVLAYYGTNVEVDRLTVGKGALEFERTKEIILRFLQPGSEIADIGGATGRYAEWLASNGHRVDLVDPVPLHVELARRRAGDPPRFGVHLGDARALPFTDGSFDAVLLFGPLYHLEEEHDRVDAMREAMRVCRRGGLIFAAAISRFAPLLDSICRGGARDEQAFANVQAETLTGHRVPEERRTSQFPEAYYHLPSEFTDELTEAGLDVQSIYGIEGPGWLLNDIDTAWLDADTRERILWAARTLETDPNFIAISDHFLAVATT
ncbi:MAG: class I SAM-dependent methyltransferase [Gaiellaceae bacterium]